MTPSAPVEPIGTAAQWALNVAMSMNPIGAVVAAIAAAVALVVGLVLIVRAVWQWMSNSAKAAEEMKQRIVEMEETTKAFRDTKEIAKVNLKPAEFHSE